VRGVVNGSECGVGEGFDFLEGVDEGEVAGEADNSEEPEESY
jgi:hypothetical protein